MNCSLAKVSKKQIRECILPFIPVNKRGFKSKVDLAEVFQCIIHKLKTGVQWSFLFAGIESVKYPFSWQLVYYYYRKWIDFGVFEQMFQTYLAVQKDKLDTENLNLDGTHSLAKKAGESVAYQHRKKGRTSNVLIITDGKGIPICLGNILSGNHHDLYQIVPQFSKMVKDLNQSGIIVENSLLNADKGFDCKRLIRACRRRKIVPNIKENPRNRKGTKRGRKRFFDQKIYQRRFVSERSFAWIDSFRILLIRFDVLDKSWLNWHYLAFALILLKV